MITFRDLRLARGGNILIDHINLQLHAGWRVGLTGANGSGKSSLFALFRNDLQPDRGDFYFPSDWVIAHVAQETPSLATPAIDYALDGDTELRSLERMLDKAEAEHDGVKIGEVHARMQEIDAYSARARAASLLHGLGFSSKDTGRPVSDFSGGWRMRLNLAQALMCRSDLLLLDEPTNHLDLDAVIWLEQWLRDYRGTLLLISHDRDFLDASISHIAHIENKQLTLYHGGYSDFEHQRAERLAQQQAMYEKQQREIDHIESYIRRFRAKATKAKQAQSRIKALERMERVAAAHVDTPFSFSFRPGPAAPDPLLKIENGAVGYEERLILDRVELTIRPGERIGLLGRNGAGKSTLIKLLANRIPLRTGTRLEGKGLAIGYFAQHQLDILRPDESPLQHMKRLDTETREQELRNYLGGFNFRGENSPTVSATTPCGTFSGGEKSRLALALLIWQRPNLLLLDEPTNHLDLEMRHALTLALQDYNGGMVLVSHDRALLRTCCDRFLLVHNGGIEPFEGNLDDYRDWLSVPGSHAASLADDTTAEGKSARKMRREIEEVARKERLAARRGLVKERQQIDKKLDEWQKEKQSLDTRMADPAFYVASDPEQLQNLLKRQALLAGWINEAETRWLAIEEMLDKLPE